jgi:hypothetical protein
VPSKIALVGGYEMENRPKRKKKRKNIIQRWFNW